MEKQQAASVITFLHSVGRLKDTPRTGWVEHEVKNPESISDHMYRMSLMCMMCPDPSLDRDKMIRMALCHDVSECIVGDISPAMKVSAEVKHQKEVQAIETLRQLVPHQESSSSSSGEGKRVLFGDELQSLFLEYEAQETPESHFVKDMDLLEMIVQAHGYEASNPGKDLKTFFNSGRKIRHPWARAILEELEATRPFLTSSQPSTGRD